MLKVKELDKVLCESEGWLVVWNNFGFGKRHAFRFLNRIMTPPDLTYPYTWRLVFLGSLDNPLFTWDVGARFTLDLPVPPATAPNTSPILSVRHSQAFSLQSPIPDPPILNPLILWQFYYGPLIP